MAKQIILENWRVEIPVEPWLGERTTERMRREAEDIQKKIKHFARAADIENDIGEPTVEADETECCDKCGSEWEVDDDGLPQCCNAAQEEWQRAQTQEGKA